jgi:hypothetical protein
MIVCPVGRFGSGRFSSARRIDGVVALEVVGRAQVLEGVATELDESRRAVEPEAVGPGRNPLPLPRLGRSWVNCEGSVKE